MGFGSFLRVMSSGHEWPPNPGTNGHLKEKIKLLTGDSGRLPGHPSLTVSSGQWSSYGPPVRQDGDSSHLKRNHVQNTLVACTQRKVHQIGFLLNSTKAFRHEVFISGKMMSSACNSSIYTQSTYTRVMGFHTFCMVH